MDERELRRDAFAECAIAELRKVEREEQPVAWMHVMDNTDGIKGNKPRVVFSASKKHPFGKPGLNYSESYPVTSKPLYTGAATHPETPTSQPDESDRLFVLLAEIRAAAGDNGERMQSELVPFIAGLARDAGRYRWLRDIAAPQWAYAILAKQYGEPDAAIDAAIRQERGKP